MRLIYALRRLYPTQFAFRSTQFDRLAGQGILEQIEKGESLTALTKAWGTGLTRFRKERAKYLLY